MNAKSFIQQIDKDRLVAAIQAAQEGNSGDIVLLVTKRKVDDAIQAAHEEFRRLSQKNVTHARAVLIFLAPESRRLAVIGGSTIYEKLPAGWWEELAGTISASFAREEMAEGLLLGIGKIGVALKTHFPSARVEDRSGQSDLIEEG